MTKRLTGLAAMALATATMGLTTACGNSTPTQGEVTIEVTCPTLPDGDQIVLALADERSLPLDTAIVSGGKATVSGNVEGEYGQMGYVLVLKNGQIAMGYPMILEPETTMGITLPANPEDDPTFAGSKSNALWMELAGKTKEIIEGGRKYIETIQNPEVQPDEIAETEQKIDSINTVVATLYTDYIVNNAPSAFSNMMLMAAAQSFSKEEMKALLDRLSSKGGDMPNYKDLKDMMERMERCVIGGQYIDFSLPAQDGAVVKLSEVVAANKLTLVDFWASWCAPCRGEMATVSKTYDAFHDKGLAIIGVSLDENGAEWMKSVEALNMKWIQVSDLRGFQSPVVQDYMVNAIPSCYLINQEGVIVAKNLRGDELYDTIAELINK